MSRAASAAARASRWLERLLMAGGTAALVWCGAVVADAAIAQRTARASLTAAMMAGRAAPPAARPEPLAARPVPRAPRRGSPLALLDIPRIDLSTVVLHGSDTETLRRGPGHLERSALPGAVGNVVIAGHRDSFFWPLRDVRVGDDLFLETPEGKFHYQVVSLTIANPSDVTALAPSDQALVTLITCYPFSLLGNAPDRLVVRAAAVVNGVAPRPAADDRTAVRQAVERFRVSYNEQLARGGVAPDGWLRFDSCDVDLGPAAATVACAARRDEGQAQTRTFALERTAAGWAIRTIVLR